MDGRKDVSLYVLTLLVAAMRAYSLQAARARIKTAAAKKMPPLVTRKTAIGIPTIAVKIRLNKIIRPLFPYFCTSPPNLRSLF